MPTMLVDHHDILPHIHPVKGWGWALWIVLVWAFARQHQMVCQMALHGRVVLYHLLELFLHFTVSRNLLIDQFCDILM